MSRQQLSLFCSAPRDRAVIQVISVKTFKTAAILFIDSVTVSMTSVTLLLTIVDIYIIMWSCPGNMPKYYPGLRDILPDPNFGILPGQDHIYIIIILSV